MPLTGREVHLTTYPRGEVRDPDFRVVDVEMRDPGPGEVLVRNTVSCGYAGQDTSNSTSLANSPRRLTTSNRRTAEKAR